MSPIQNGKKPLSARAISKPAEINMDDIFGNPLGIDPAILEAITKAGLSFRFINAKRLQDMGGYHPNHWRPFRKSDHATINTSQDFQFGNGTDDTIRRGDMVLAVRSKEINDKHNAYLKQEAARSKNMQQAHAESLREYVRGHSLKDRVTSGYEDDGESEDN